MPDKPYQHPPTREKALISNNLALMSAKQFSLETHYGKTLFKSLPTLVSKKPFMRIIVLYCIVSDCLSASSNVND